MSWITTKLLAYALGASWLVILAVSGYAYTQHQEAKHQESEKRIARLELGIATSANQATNDLLARMTAERDGLLLKRAAEAKAAQAAIADTEAKARVIAAALLEARSRLKGLSLLPNCMAAMQAPICPEVADELRKAP